MKKYLLAIAAIAVLGSAMFSTGCDKEKGGDNGPFSYTEPFIGWQFPRASVKDVAPTKFLETTDGGSAEKGYIDVYEGDGATAEYWYLFDGNERLISVVAWVYTTRNVEMEAYMRATHTYEQTADGGVLIFVNKSGDTAMAYLKQPFDELSMIEYVPNN